MKAPIFVSALVAAAALAGAAQARDYACSGEAEGSNEMKVDVTFTVDDKGTVKQREASWSVPDVSGRGALLILTGAPAVSVNYAPTSATALGASTGLSTFSMAMTNSDAPYRGAAMIVTLPDGRAFTDDEPVLAVGRDGKTVSMVMTMGQFAPAEHAELFADLDLLGRVKVTLKGAPEKPIAETLVDFSGRAERDALFAQAWAKAEAAAAKPKKCKKAE